MAFEFATANRILFGPGSVRDLAPAARQMGTRALLVTGRSPERLAEVSGQIAAVGVNLTGFPVDGEPTVDAVRRGLLRALEDQCELVISLGGGSAIDAGKAIAVLLTNGGDPLDYIEVIGAGKSLTKPSAGFIAVPTTAGTGTEVTRNAVLASPEHGVKASLRSAHMLPRLAVVDPELTYDLAPALTASTGLDALTQLIEPYVSSRANPMVDLFCLEGMRRAGRALVRAYQDGADREARTDMAFASLMGGLSLANAGLGGVHGFAAVIGGMVTAPHGAVCAALLPCVMEVNIRALRARSPQSKSLGRYETIARILSGDSTAPADEAVRWAAATVEQLGIPALGSYGIGPGQISAIVEKAAKASSMKANPIVLTSDELTEIVTRAL